MIISSIFHGSKCIIYGDMLSQNVYTSQKREKHHLHKYNFMVAHFMM
jgi:hypothetical protein